MRTREEIESDYYSSMAGRTETDQLITVMEWNFKALMDIRDLLLASEQRTQQFTQELERLRRPAGSTFNVEALRTIPEGDPYWRVDKFDDED